MAIKNLNPHYAIENSATIYDEEALTGLQLAGQHRAKIIELIENFNRLDKDTIDKLFNMEFKQIPETVAGEIQSYIANGEFDRAIAAYANHLDQRVENLLGSVSEGSTTLDAEVIDLRASLDGHTYSSAGKSIRNMFHAKVDKGEAIYPHAHTENLLNEDGKIYGKYYRDSDGALITSTSAYHYPPIEIGEGVQLSLFNVQILVAFDANHNVLYSGSHASTEWETFTTPAGCAYIIVSKSMSNTKLSGVYLGDPPEENTAGYNLLEPDQVVGLADLMENALRRTPGKNMFKNGDTTGDVLDKYQQYTNGVIGAHSSYNIRYLDVEPNTTYTLRPSKNYHICFLDASGSFISGVGGWANLTFTTPATCASIALSYPKSALDTLQMEKGAIATPWTPYCNGLASEDLNLASVEARHLAQSAIDLFGGGKEVVTVGPTGCQYTSLLEAMIDRGENTVFHVQAGTYDLVAEYINHYGETYFADYVSYREDSDKFAAGLYLKPGCELIGIGPVKIVFNYDCSNENVCKYFSTLNTTYNNVVKNLHLDMTDRAGRYHIHDDFAVAGTPGNLHIQNVYMTGMPYLGTMIGSGMGTCNTYLIEDCVAVMSEGSGIAYHNNVAAGKNMLTIRNCNLGGGSIYLRSYGESTEKSIVMITGCKCNQIVHTFTDEATYPNVNIEVYEWNNEKAEG